MKNVIRVIIRLVLSKYFAIMQNVSSIKYWLLRGRSFKNINVCKDVEIVGRNLAIFASFQAGPNVFLECQLRELRKAGFDCIYVSNIKLRSDFVKWLSALTSVIIERPNLARDFGAYKAGYLYVKSRGWIDFNEELLFVNDTIFFPVYDAAEFWTKLRARKEDVVGAFESFSPVYHLQSFFILCRNGVQGKSIFDDYWSNYVEWNSRNHAIAHGELGFSSELLRCGASIGALIDQQYLADKANFYGNASDLALLDWNKYLAERLWELPDAEISRLIQIQVSRALEIGNPSHNLARYAILRAGLPMLKKDVVYRGSLLLGDVIILHEEAGITLPLQAMIQFLKKKGLPSESRFFRRLKDWAGAS